MDFFTFFVVDEPAGTTGTTTTGPTLPTLATDNHDELRRYVNSKINPNTLRKTNQCINRFQRWLLELLRKDDRPLIDIPVTTMDCYIGGFLMGLKREDGSDYEPDTLTAFHRAIKRRLDEIGYGHDILKSVDFDTSRKVLAAKRKELKQSGKGNRPNKAEPLNVEDEDKLWKTGQLGTHSPEALYNTIWYFNAKLFGFRGCQEARQLKWGDIELCSTDEGEFLQFNERETKTRSGNSTHIRPFKPKIFAIGGAKYPIEAYKKFSANRPSNMNHADSPFYLAVNYKPAQATNMWFKALAMGQERLQKTMARMATNAGLSGHYTNHSVRKTMCTQLLHAGVPPTTIIQLSGHKNVMSLNNYATASKDQQRCMSNILVGQKRTNTDLPTLAAKQPRQAEIQVQDDLPNVSSVQESRHNMDLVPVVPVPTLADRQPR
jgi:hypothetical protein